MTIRRLSLTALLALAILGAAGCASFQNDRAWIPKSKFTDAKRIYDTTGSLALTEQALRENPTWQRGEVNEAVYRLRKINNIAE